MRLNPPSAPIKYKKPSGLNGVSLVLLLLVCAAGYVAFSAWPAFSLKGRVKGEMEDALVQLYRANLRPEPLATQETLATKRRLFDTLRKAGVADKKLEIVVARNKQTVSIEARFSTEVVLQGLDKRFTMTHSPRVQTDASRVDW